jgi:hypothetical protein
VYSVVQRLQIFKQLVCCVLIVKTILAKCWHGYSVVSAASCALVNRVV